MKTIYLNVTLSVIKVFLGHLICALCDQGHCYRVAHLLNISEWLQCPYFVQCVMQLGSKGQACRPDAVTHFINTEISKCSHHFISAHCDLINCYKLITAFGKESCNVVSKYFKKNFKDLHCMPSKNILFRSSVEYVKQMWVFELHWEVGSGISPSQPPSLKPTFSEWRQS